MWVLGKTLRLNSKYLYLLNHVISPLYLVFEAQCVLRHQCAQLKGMLFHISYTHALM